MASFPQERGVFPFARLCAYAMFDRHGLWGETQGSGTVAWGRRSSRQWASNVRREAGGLDGGVCVRTRGHNAVGSGESGHFLSPVLLHFALVRRHYMVLVAGLAGLTLANCCSARGGSACLVCVQTVVSECNI